MSEAGMTSSEATARINELLGEKLKLEQENRLLRKTVSVLEEQKKRLSGEVRDRTNDLRSWEGSTRRFNDRLYHGRHVVRPRYDQD